MGLSYNISRRSLTGGAAGDSNVERVNATVKNIEKAPNFNEKCVKVYMIDDKCNGAIYVPNKYAKHLKPERSYAFHLEESTYRGSENKRFSSTGMIRRTSAAPEEVKKSGLNGGGQGSGLGKL